MAGLALALFSTVLVAASPVQDALCLAAGLPSGSDVAAENERAFRLEKAQQAQVRYLRHDFLWDRIEPEPGVFDFSDMDRNVDAALEAGVEYIGVLCYGNPDYSSQTADDPAFPPDDPADFANFVHETVAHFRGRVHNWEIWNEPNVGLRFWKPTLSGDPEAYGDLVKVSFDAAKAADPTCTVALGGTFYPNLVVDGGVRFLEDVYAAHPDLGDYYDVMAYHPYRYPFTAPEVENRYQDSLLTSIEEMKALLARHGDSDKPLWITEMGWHTATNQPVFSGTTYLDQARFLVRGYLLALSASVEEVCWYTFADGDYPWVWQEDAFGLFVQDDDWTDGLYPAAKPSYGALVTMAHTLDGLEFADDLTGELGLAGQGYAFRFDGLALRVVVAWVVEDTDSAHVTLTRLPPTVQVVTMDGTMAEVQTDQGSLTVPLSGSPTYVVIEGG